MSRKHKVFDSSKPHFVTSSVVDWIKIFEDRNISNILIESIKYSQLNKGLEIYAFVIMPDHFHMICRSISELSLPDIFRDMKKYTSRSITCYMMANMCNLYSIWLKKFQCGDSTELPGNRFRIWQEGLFPKELTSNRFIDQKIDYVHNNPVRAGLVEKPEDYLLSSARNYSEHQGIIDVVVSHGRWFTY